MYMYNNEQRKNKFVEVLKTGGCSSAQTSPMPEDAPVISITFPATSSRYMDFMVEMRSLKNRYVGRKKTSIVRPVGGTTRFKTL